MAADDEVLEDESAPRQQLVGPTACRRARAPGRKLNGRASWPLFMFANAIPESLMARMGKIYIPKPMAVKTRKELLASVKPSMRRLAPDTGDMPDGEIPPPPAHTLHSAGSAGGVIRILDRRDSRAG